MNKFIKLLQNPQLVVYKISLKFIKKKLWKIGVNSNFGFGTSFKGERYIYIGDNFMCGKNVKLYVWNNYLDSSNDTLPKLKIGDNVTFADGCFISCINNIEIKNGVLFGENVFVSDNFHGNNSIDELNIPPAQRTLYSKGPVIIGNNVWIGRNVSIMPNIKIGNNSIIGANAVVTHDVPENTIVAGVPAKIIKKIE